MPQSTNTLCLTLFVLLLPSLAVCEPITLAFEAEISEAAGAGWDDLPFQLTQGDKVSGLLKINSQPESESSSLEIKIESFRLATKFIEVSVFDDTSFDDGPFDAQTIDVIQIGCGVSPLANCQPTPTTVADSKPFIFRVQIELVGDATALDTNKLPHSDITLNSLQLQRSLLLAFDLDGPGSVVATATIGKFKTIPEPSAATMACIASLAIARLPFVGSRLR